MINKLKSLFDGEFEILIKGGDNQLVIDSQMSFLNEETDRAASLWSFRQGKMSGWSTETLPSAKALYLPIMFSRISLGVLVYYSKNKKPLSIDEENFLQTVTEQLAIYLERYVFEERTQTQNYMRQVEKLHTAIFQSLSKDLYTPLEKISNISREFSQIAHYSAEKGCVASLNQAVQNFRTIIDNVLIISQLKAGFISFDKQKYSIKILIEEILQDISLLINGHSIHVQFLEEDLFFYFDFKLMKIALKNILINILEHSPVEKPIEIIVQLLDNQFRVTFIDKRPTVSQEMGFLYMKNFLHYPVCCQIQNLRVWGLAESCWISDRTTSRPIGSQKFRGRRC